MKIKHLLLIPIIGYLIYLMHHAFTVSFALNESEQSSFDMFAITVTSIILLLLLVLLLVSLPFIYEMLKKHTTIFKRINKFLNHKIL